MVSTRLGAVRGRFERFEAGGFQGVSSMAQATRASTLRDRRSEVDAPAKSEMRPLERSRRSGKSRLRSIRAGTLPEEVAARIVEGIGAGRWLPGERIFEVELAEELKVSRIPVRSALKALEKQGIVHTIPHRGTYVMDIDEDKIRQVFMVRLDLELHACAEAVRNVQADPAHLDALRKIVDDMHEAADKRDIKRFDSADLDFHNWLVETSGIDILNTLWAAMSQHMQIFFAIVGEEWRDLATKFEEHRRMCELIEQGDTDGLREMLRYHIVDSFSR
jgi:DNA-binding GntR family transcriptional regulator